MMGKRYSVFIVAMAFLIGCSSTKTTDQSTDLSQTGVEGYIKQRQSALISFTGHGSMATTMRNKQRSAQFKIALYQSDSLLLSVYGPLGVIVGRLQATPQKFLFHDVLKSSAISGDPTEKNLKRAIRVPLTMDDIAALLRGDIPNGFTGFKLHTNDDIKTEDTRQVYIRQHGDRIERVIFSPEKQAVVEYSRKRRGEKTEVQARYSKFITENGVRIAKYLAFQFPKERINVTLGYTDLEVNVPEESYSFTLPSDIIVQKM